MPGPGVKPIFIQYHFWVFLGKTISEGLGPNFKRLWKTEKSMGSNLLHVKLVAYSLQITPIGK